MQPSKKWEGGGKVLTGNLQVSLIQAHTQVEEENRNACKEILVWRLDKEIHLAEECCTTTGSNDKV